MSLFSKSWLRHSTQAPILSQQWHRMMVPPLTHPEHHYKIVNKYWEKMPLKNSHCSFGNGLPFLNSYLIDSFSLSFRLGLWRFWQARFPSNFGERSGRCSCTSRTHASVTDIVLCSDWFSLRILRSSGRGHCELHFTTITLPFLILSRERFNYPKKESSRDPMFMLQRTLPPLSFHPQHVPSMHTVATVRAVAWPIAGEQHESIWSSCCAGAPIWRAPAANTWRRGTVLDSCTCPGRHGTISGEQHEFIWSSCCAGAPKWRAPAANR